MRRSPCDWNKERWAEAHPTGLFRDSSRRILYQRSDRFALPRLTPMPIRHLLIGNCHIRRVALESASIKHGRGERPALETRATQCALLCNVPSNRREFRSIDPGMQPLSVRGGPLLGRDAQRQVCAMRRNQRIAGLAQMGMHAGPAILLRQCSHGGTHRVQLDISAHGQCISVGIDQAGFVAALP